MSKYKFKGYTITNCGYHQPDHCVWWEAVNENGEACFHGNTLREVEFEILDYEWEQKLWEKESEIERLKETSVGNAAAMREAIAKCVNLIIEFGNAEIVKTPLDVIVDIESILKDALSAPPRNCDVGTPEEQGVRYNAYCRKHFTPDQHGGNCRKCPLRDRRGWSCQLVWAQMPYAAKEGAGE